MLRFDYEGLWDLDRDDALVDEAATLLESLNRDFDFVEFECWGEE